MEIQKKKLESKQKQEYQLKIAIQNKELEQQKINQLLSHRAAKEQQ